MKTLSTRGVAPLVAISQAIAAGLAPDGGLYMPEQWPTFEPADFDGDATLAQVAGRMLTPFFADDPIGERLADICDDAFAVEPPLRGFGNDGDFLLELFHGPTAAFKDYGAAFLAGLATGVWSGTDELRALRESDDVFTRSMDPMRVQVLLAGWHEAIRRTI